MKDIGRREFIRTGTLAGVGLGLGLNALGSAAAGPVPNEPWVRRYSRLGRTGMEIYDISFGADRLSSGQEDLVQHACDLGINYFDTAETYRGGDSETTLGRATRQTPPRLPGVEDARVARHHYGGHDASPGGEPAPPSDRLC